MVDKIFNVTWVPLTNDVDQFIGISHCPGKFSKEQGSSGRLHNDLKSLKNQKIEVIISLTPETEIERLGIVNFSKSLKDFGFIHCVEPIDDFSVPKSHRLKNVNELIKKILDLLRDKKSILVHCNAGLGRSGIIVAIIIKAIGSVKDPVGHLRKFRFGAIETEEQQRFITNFDF